VNSAKESYSQSGEDLIVDFIFDTLKINTRHYLDVGAHDPTNLSNTYLFYSRGHRGVAVEPDPDLVNVFTKQRPEDTCLNVGVGEKKQRKVPFYLMEPSTLNTFSEKEAQTYQKYYPWTSLRKIVKMPIVNINDVVKKHFKDGLDFLSIDTEGLDTAIIKSIDFKKYQPTVICVETAVYTGKSSLTKNQEIITYLRHNNYFVYADTFVNTIFVHYQIWHTHGGATLEGF